MDDDAGMERGWKVLIVVSVAVFMVSLDLFIVNVASPEIRRDFARASLAAGAASLLCSAGFAAMLLALFMTRVWG